MVLFFIALFIGIPFVWHWFVYDRAEVSARSAFLLGVGCGTFSGLRESWQIGILVFFLAAFFAFAIAYLLGLIYARSQVQPGVTTWIGSKQMDCPKGGASLVPQAPLLSQWSFLPRAGDGKPGCG